MLEVMKEEKVDLLSDLLEHVKKEEIKVLNLPSTQENFSITTPEQANFFIGRIKEIQEDIEKVEQTAKDEKERIIKHIDGWKDKEVSKHQQSIDFLMGALEVFFAEESDGKAISLPNGSINYRKQPLKYEYISENDILRFAIKENIQDAIKIKRTLDKTELKKNITVKDGKGYIENKEVPGLNILKQEPKFTIR